MTDTTPADELRTAASRLRQMRFPTAMTATTSTATLISARNPLADWLDAEAHHYECGIRAADDVFHDDPAGREAFLTTRPGAPSPQALAVARAINAAEEPTR